MYMYSAEGSYDMDDLDIISRLQKSKVCNFSFNQYLPRYHKFKVKVDLSHHKFKVKVDLSHTDKLFIFPGNMSLLSDQGQLTLPIRCMGIPCCMHTLVMFLPSLVIGLPLVHFKARLAEKCKNEK